MAPIYLNGRIVAEGDAGIDPSDRGLLLGDGLFDTATAFGRRVWRREAHVARLAVGAEALGIPLEPGALDAALDALLPFVPEAGAVIRTTLTRGPGPRGLKPPDDPAPTLLATFAPWSPALVLGPVRLALAGARRNDRSPLARIKTLGYLDAILETERARRRGFDDALFLDTADRVACSTMANVFVLAGRRLVTPPAAGGILPGIARARLIELAPALGMRVEEARLTLDDLAAADAVFLTNSVRLVAPVTAFEQRAYPGPGLAAARLAAAALAADIAAECGSGFALPD